MSWSSEEWPAHRARLMAAAMQPIEKQTHDEQLWRELTDYLCELNQTDSELRCQSNHNDPQNLECSSVVTHRVTDCIGPINVCAMTARHAQRAITDPCYGRMCARCDAPPATHWEVRPI